MRLIQAYRWMVGWLSEVDTITKRIAFPYDHPKVHE
jgi:hypothetical protein